MKVLLKHPRLIPLVFTVLSVIICALPLSSQESEIHDPSAYLTNRLPILYVNTVDSVPITSKTYFVEGSMYINSLGINGYESLGSAEAPLPLIIRGCGSATWISVKKSYEIRLDSAASPLGMNAHTHWELQPRSTDNMGFIKEEVGYELSRYMGLPFAPRQLPVEMVLNGDYVGIYFIAESVLVGENRVNITPSVSLDEDPDHASGGWLIEMANYQNSYQITHVSHDGATMRFSHRTPGELSDVQRAYGEQLITAIDDALYAPNKSDTTWETIIDIDDLAKYYLICEITDNTEAFSAYTYFYKDRGDDVKVHWGPVYDFSGSASRKENYTKYFFESTPSYVHNNWVKELMKFPRFQKRLRELWAEYSPGLLDYLKNYTYDFVMTYDMASTPEHQRWPTLKNNSLRNRRATYINNFLTPRFEFCENTLTDASDSLHNVLTSNNRRIYHVLDDVTTVYKVNLTDSVFVFAHDADRNWVRLQPPTHHYEQYDSMQVIKGGTLSGLLQNHTSNPTLVLTDVPDIEPATEHTELRHFDLTVDTLNAVGNEVMYLRGYYHAAGGKHYLASNNYKSRNGVMQYIEMSLDWTNDTINLVDGYIYTLPVVVQHQYAKRSEAPFTTDNAGLRHYRAYIIGQPTEVDTVSNVIIYDPEYYDSHTLPVLYINTENGTPITTKTEYLNGTYYLDAMGIEGYEDIASAGAPQVLQIRGRGNATWNAEKKPYKIKLDKKTSLLGMNRSKHWALLPHMDDHQAYLKDEIGFEISRRVGLEYTPSQRPIELAVNGDYLGIYFICETVRVEDTRVNITSQDDEETDPEMITGGWLMEIDNYSDPNQIVFASRSGTNMRITPDSPEKMSVEQQDYLRGLINQMDSLIFVTDKSSTAWEELIDLDAIAKHYFVNECVDNTEAYSGSCFFYKERGDDEMVYWGPVWDFGSSNGRWENNYFLYEKTPWYAFNHWIGEIAKFPRFQKRVRELWAEFGPTLDQEMKDYSEEFLNLYVGAESPNRTRWPNQSNDRLSRRRVTYFTRYFTPKTEWLNHMWTEVTDSLANIITAENHLDYHVIDDLAIVDGVHLGDSAFVFTRNDANQWLRLQVPTSWHATLMHYNSIRGNSVDGLLTNSGGNATLTITDFPDAYTDSVNIVEPGHVVLSDSTYTPIANEVVVLHGTVHQENGRYYLVDDLENTGQAIELDTSWAKGKNSLSEGFKCDLRVAIQRRYRPATGLPSPLDDYKAFVLEFPYVHLNGDINCDDIVDAIDLNILINIILGAELSPERIEYADVNGDGSVNGIDINAIINIILGK